MIMIIVSHIILHQYEMYGSISCVQSIPITIIFLKTIFNSSIGVCIFMIISGYYGMTFRWSKMVKLEMLAIICGVLSFVVVLINNEGVELYSIIGKLFPLTRSGWWFYTSYVIIFFLSPIINKGVEQLTNQQFRQVVICMILSVTFIGNLGGYDRIGGPILLLSAYLIGMYIKRNNIVIKGSLSWYLFAQVMVSVLMIYLTQLKLFNFCNVIQSHCSIFTFIQAVLLFLYFRSKSFHLSAVNKMASAALSVYFLHESGGGIFVLSKIFRLIDSVPQQLLFVYIVVVSVATYFVCSILYLFFLKPVITRTVMYFSTQIKE